ncbi:1-deoxy-D-xylulose-5-phosphate synthase [Alkalidesulfovibrio alkalitolerans DSM 16529]|uniref:1-deoxy-D-xylulose-5-phosphate synthase n=1 Tax=Alkalidesulfovibrio alkalitolerans DSM 16529 TaxID=1121439 RepID=S7TAT3_9BACT|nr:1-deoxy-D-xylulose-5-phosphate synthase [Alkalidesulfovibrio alkalitolerans]EPR34232.1 1-deoxy-D-xylulose-5-phosphate synthase [Alkalidesulfovibrio alkalitolerans DSM 16529]
MSVSEKIEPGTAAPAVKPEAETARASLLETLPLPSGVRDLGVDDLARLAQEIRGLMISTVSRTGGHLAPGLGVVELTLALYKVFNPAHDRFVWDVGHQAYAHKILTGRAGRFGTLRQFGGVSGFPRPAEAPEYDHFGVGHSSTSISAALGMAVARDLKGEARKVLAVIGDGSMTAGLAYEGLNQAGGMERDLIVVLNDNEMSISKNVGALSSFLSRNLSTPWLMRLKKDFEQRMRSLGRIGEDLANLARKGEDSFKHFFTPGTLFQSFGFNYLGPIDGHDMKELLRIFELVKELEGPTLIHVLTKKGKGYEPAEDNPTYFHGVGCFEPETGRAKKFAGCVLPSYTEVFGNALCELATADPRIVAITAAMPEGTGLSRFAEKHPERFVDVGICEQHAVTFAAGLAREGFKPVVAIYSTFLQRSYDQIVHDVCLQNLPVTFCLDRGGLVGEDGATHHGAFDMSYLRHIPNIIVMAAKDEAELRDLLATAMAHDGPAALRYPRGVGVGADCSDRARVLPVGKGELLRDGRELCVLAVGSRVYPCVEAAEELEQEQGLKIAVFNARFIKPLDEKAILELARRFKAIVTVEENALAGGFGSAVLELLADKDVLSGLTVRRLGLPDHFVEHGTQKELRVSLGLDKGGIKRSLLEMEGK